MAAAQGCGSGHPQAVHVLSWSQLLSPPSRLQARPRGREAIVSVSDASSCILKDGCSSLRRVWCKAPATAKPSQMAAARMHLRRKTYLARRRSGGRASCNSWPPVWMFTSRNLPADVASSKYGTDKQFLKSAVSSMEIGSHLGPWKRRQCGWPIKQRLLYMWHLPAPILRKKIMNIPLNNYSNSLRLQHLPVWEVGRRVPLMLPKPT